MEQRLVRLPGGSVKRSQVALGVRQVGIQLQRRQQLPQGRFGLALHQQHPAQAAVPQRVIRLLPNCLGKLALRLGDHVVLGQSGAPVVPRNPGAGILPDRLTP